MREIQSQHWDAFCDRLNRFEDGGTVSIEFQDRQGTRTELARRAPFEGIGYGRRDDCNDQIVVRGTTKHEIVEPIHILLRETEDGAAFNAVAIEAEEGTTFLIFHPVIRPQWLEGVL